MSSGKQQRATTCRTTQGTRHDNRDTSHLFFMLPDISFGIGVIIQMCLNNVGSSFSHYWNYHFSLGSKLIKGIK